MFATCDCRLRSRAESHMHPAPQPPSGAPWAAPPPVLPLTCSRLRGFPSAVSVQVTWTFNNAGASSICAFGCGGDAHPRASMTTVPALFMASL